MAYNPERVTSNQIAYQALREQGLSKCQAAKSLGLSNSYPAYLERTGKLKYDLTAKKMVSRAHLAIKNILEGQPVGESEAPKPSTIVTAASMIYDRYQPVVHHSTNITANISPVDMSKYMINIDNSMSAQLIDNQSVGGQEGAASLSVDVPIPIEGEGRGEGVGKKIYIAPLPKSGNFPENHIFHPLDMSLTMGSDTKIAEKEENGSNG